MKLFKLESIPPEWAGKPFQRYLVLCPARERERESDIAAHTFSSSFSENLYKIHEEE